MVKLILLTHRFLDTIWAGDTESAGISKQVKSETKNR